MTPATTPALTLNNGIAFSSDVQMGGGTLTLGGNLTVSSVAAGATGTLASSPGAIINGNLNLGAGVARTITVNDSATPNDLTITGTVIGVKPFSSAAE